MNGCPKDAAIFAIAIAAARSPTEAVEIVTAYRSAPMTSALFNGPAGCTPLTIGPGVLAELRESAITALASDLEGPHPNVAAPNSLRVAVHRSVKFPPATVYEDWQAKTGMGDGKSIDLRDQVGLLTCALAELAARVDGRH